MTAIQISSQEVIPLLASLGADIMPLSIVSSFPLTEQTDRSAVTIAVLVSLL
jgi:hypothetical protein